MTTTPAEHQRLLRLATRASLAVASILVLSKALAWWLSGSVSLLAGLTDSALDAVASFLNCSPFTMPCARPTMTTVTAMARPKPWPGWHRRCSLRSVQC